MRGRAGKKSKQMMVPGERFPPLRGNSSDLKVTRKPPALPNFTHILYADMKYDPAKVKLAVLSGN